MLLSELSGKEIVNLHDGAKLGLIGDSDIKITAEGKIEAIIIASRSGGGRFFSKNTEREGSLVVIPWKAIKKVGTEVIIVDIDYAQFS
ncbi:YlmC/YmxH family sporulation protein [Dehalobacter sp. DCM]|uniref:YlmC/YmxH family sporulation protein n=1 Tax=Dehalobacter sp. DCM TaxID=2907827 RepID=UPI003081BA3A|nr:YlmC/YmxH family sporulation protein [Dehalobacter sp. DCM]